MMLDRYLLGIQNKVLRPLASRMAAAGVRADAITILGFCIGLVACALIAREHYVAALALFLLNRLCDGLDGAVARQTRPTDRGAFLDIAFDFLIYGLFPLAFAIARPGANALAASLLLASFMGTGSSFLAFAAVAARRGILAAEFPRKGIYYLGGLTEGTETIAAFALMCVWPDWFPVIATIFSALALVTTVMRWAWGWRAFSEDVS
jgi:phosphatidylglycerophosphate synthase